MTSKIYSLFEVVGIEIEYMLVDQNSLDVVPKVDQLLAHFAHDFTNEIAFNKIAVSNELVNHVIELKMNGPQPITMETHLDFHQTITQHLSQGLSELNCTLMPTSMHPFLYPESPSIQVWQHGNKEIYETYDAIFGCRGHGFSNIQSIHLNLPFANEEEFVQLHHAIRTLLPILPAFCASSPIVEGKPTSFFDNRLMYYKNNQSKIPIIAGDIIPEPISSIAAYYELILDPIEQALKPMNPSGILESEWVNSRGAIARFDRNAIEIRLIDSQECPLADVACAAAIKAFLQYLIDERNIHLQSPYPTLNLKNIMLDTLKNEMQSNINDPAYAQLFGIATDKAISVQALLEHLFEKTRHLIDSVYHQPLEMILQKGSLSRRIRHELERNNFSEDAIKSTYKRLCECLTKNELF